MCLRPEKGPLISPSKYDDSFYKAVWHKIYTNFKGDLSRFDGLYLIPLSDRRCLSLEKLAPIVNLAGFSEKEAELLNNVGIVVVGGVPSYVLNHPQSSDYITPKHNLSEAMFKLAARNDLEEAFEGLGGDEKRAWISLLNKCDLSRMTDLVRSLPIFKVYSSAWTCGSAGGVGLGVDLSDFTFKIPIEKAYLDLTTSESKELAKKLGVQLLPLSKFVIAEVFPSVVQGGDAVVCREFGKYCLNMLEDLSAHDNRFKERLADLAFVPNESGHLFRPRDLLDHWDDEIRALFGSIQRFPGGEYCERRYEYVLKDLGLRGRRNVLIGEVTAVAKSVDALNARGDKSCVELSKRLVEFLKKSNHLDCAKIDGTIRWIWTMQFPPRYVNLTSDLWAGKKCMVASRSDICHSKHANICASTRAFCQEADNLLKLGEPTVEDVVCHLRNVIGSKNMTKTNGILSDAVQWAKKSDLIQQFKAELNKQKIRKLVRVSEEYTEAKRVVCGKMSHQLEPYLFKLPHELKEHADFLQECGAPKELSQDLLVEVLREIANAKCGKPLNKEECKAVQTVAMCLHDLKGEGETHIETQKEVHLPNKWKVMRNVNELSHDSEPWLESDVPSEQCFSGIPYPHASYLGVKNHRDVVIGRYSFGVPFGQREDLTTRIQGLLKGYPIGSIFRELIQNADDARATEIEFIVDPREHPTEKIFDANWKALQGPGLLVRNNGSFSEEDLEGIKDLGRGSKRDDPVKTGQYGVGFNCVYNVTDTPTFMTQVVGQESPVLCVFDPKCRNVYGASHAIPGMMFVAEAEKVFPDAFRPYKIENFDPTKGVLFRLPLRTKSQAEEDVSVISKRAVYASQLAPLLKDFMAQEAGECLLFLKSIRRIIVSQMTPLGSRKQIGMVVAELRDEDVKSLRNFHDRAVKMVADLHNNGNVSEELEILRPIQIEYSMKARREWSGGESSQAEWSLVQQTGFSSTSGFSKKLTGAILRGDIRLNFCAGVAYNRSDPGANKKKKVFCLLPLKMESELRFHVNGHFALNYESRDCLIPDGEKPVLTEWNMQVLREIVAPCAARLIALEARSFPRNAVASGIQEITEMFPPPHTKLVGLLEGMYKSLYCSEGRVMPVTVEDSAGGRALEWLPVKEVFFDRTPEGAKEELKRTLIRCGMPVLPKSPKLDEIADGFEKHDLPISSLSPGSVGTFLRGEASARWAPSSPVPVSSTPFRTNEEVTMVLWYVMNGMKREDNGSCLIDGLLGLPLLLTENEDLMRLQCNVLYKSRNSRLVPSRRREFLSRQMIDCFRKVRVRAGGRVFKELTIEDLAPMLDSELNTSMYKSGMDVPFHVDEEGKIKVEGDQKMKMGYLHDLWSFCNQARASGVEDPVKRMQPLKDWSLLPCMIGDRCFLTPISNRYHVFHIDSEVTVREVLERVPIRGAFLRWKYDSFYSKVISSLAPENANHLIKALAECVRNDPSSTRPIQEGRAKLLSYLQVRYTQFFL